MTPTQSSRVSRRPTRVASALLCGLALFTSGGAQAEFSATATGYDLMTWFITRCGPGWVAGDGAFSAKLPNGDVAWWFGDSAIGRVSPTDRLDPWSMVVGNTLAIQNASSPTAPELTSYYRNASNTPISRVSYKGFFYDYTSLVAPRMAHTTREGRSFT